MRSWLTFFCFQCSQNIILLEDDTAQIIDNVVLQLKKIYLLEFVRSIILWNINRSIKATFWGQDSFPFSGRKICQSLIIPPPPLYYNNIFSLRTGPTLLPKCTERLLICYYSHLLLVCCFRFVCKGFVLFVLFSCCISVLVLDLYFDQINFSINNK